MLDFIAFLTHFTQSGMFDNDASGTIDVYEFEKLYNYINQWLVRSL